MPAGPELDLDPRLRVLVLALQLGLGQAQAPLAAGEERRRNLLEVVADGAERLLEAALDGLGQLVAQVLELLQALLEVGALVAELGEPLLLALVLLLRERVDAAEGLASALEARELLGELLGIVALGRLGARLLDPALELLRLGRERRQLDVDRRGSLTGLGGGPAQLGLLRAELAQLLAELPSPAGLSRRRGRRGSARSGPRASRPRRGSPSAARPPRPGADPTRRAGRRLLGRRLEPLDLGLESAPPCLQLEQHGLGRLARVPELAPLRGRRRSLRASPRAPLPRAARALSTIGASGRAPPTTTPRFPSPAARACSRNLSAVAASGASTAPARQESAAAIARSSPGSTSSDERTSRSPCSASTRAAGGSPSSSASARSSAPSRSRPSRASSRSRSRSGERACGGLARSRSASVWALSRRCSSRSVALFSR